MDLTGLADAAPDDPEPEFVDVNSGNEAVLGSAELPLALASGATSSGFGGVAVTGTGAGGDEVVWVAFQGDWGDGPDGLVKVGRYEVATRRMDLRQLPARAVASPAEGAVVGQNHGHTVFLDLGPVEDPFPGAPT